jgi:hypothetical protein
MKQLELNEVRAMSFEQLGAVEDPMDLMATGSVAPILVRYAVRTGQLVLLFHKNNDLLFAFRI